MTDRTPDSSPGDSDAYYTPETPFVTVQSRGGPHDDTAYAAGYEMGQLDSTLLTVSTLRGMQILPTTTLIRTLNAPQADMIATKYGLVAEFAALPDTPEWSTMLIDHRSSGNP